MNIKFWPVNLTKGGHVEDLGVDRKILVISKWTFEK
jgi:hypothetical protein